MGSRSENPPASTYTILHFRPNTIVAIMRPVYLVAALAFVSVASAQFKCPKPDGTFEDSRQCDRYYEC